MLEFSLLAAIALLPSLLWLFFFLRKDTKEPEPIRLLLKIFTLAALLAIPIAVVESWFLQFVFAAKDEGVNAAIWLAFMTSMILVAPIEEYAKYWIAKTVLFRNKKYFTQIVDGMVYMAVAAGGFAFAENFFYFYGRLRDDTFLQELARGSVGVFDVFTSEAFYQVFILRLLGATLTHFAASAVLGYFWGVYWFKKTQVAQSKALLIGFLAAIILHGMFNFFLLLTELTQIEFGPIAIMLTIIWTTYVFYQFWKKENLKVYK